MDELVRWLPDYQVVATSVAIGLLIELRAYTAVHVARIQSRQSFMDRRLAVLERKLSDWVDPADGEAA